MTEATATTEIPEDIGRNDPCPCGSGEKYKKCCMRTHRVQKEAQKSSRRPEQLIGSGTTPWNMFKLLRQMRENNMPNLFWETSHPLGPFRQQYPSKESYFEALGAGTENMVIRDGFELERVRHDGPDVMLLVARGVEDPHVTTVVYEVITLRPNELDENRATRAAEHRGFRVWNVERHERKKAEIEGEIGLSELGYEWQAAWVG